MTEWKWVQRINETIESSEYLERNRLGADVGEVLGGTAGVLGLGVGVVYVGVALAPTAVAAETAGAATVAAGGIGAAAYKAGHFAGKTTAKMALKNGLKAVWAVGRLGGAYAGASAQSGARWIGETIREL
jgi:hypothetical protein